MPEEKKKTYEDFNGNRVLQELDSNFKEEYKEWREHCKTIGSGDLVTKRVPNLYVFLKEHFKKVRKGSRNEPHEGKGVNTILDSIDAIVDSPDITFTVREAKIIEAFATVLEGMKDTGKETVSNGGSGMAADPAFILFTETVKDEDGEPTGEINEVQGHYATAEYAKGKEGQAVAPAAFFAGENPPHMALFSETAGKFAQPRGLLYIMRDASKIRERGKTSVIVDTLDSEPEELEKLSAIEDYFNAVVRNKAFWNAGGRLLTSKVRKDFLNQKFRMTNRDQAIVREIANLGQAKDNDALAGKVEELQFGIKLTATALPIITLVDRALKRKNTNKAPNGFRAWQQERKTGFDYRKTAKEAYPKNYGPDAPPKKRGQFQMKPTQKVISKMWQQILWRD